ncbi:hypothetical protein GCM10012285_27680 [Streptomyces kronopolitis]|uniref:Uncharacterized protein n=1 Tax=Streptomyces kronopolitis TaxID=1612435 RepID=A0ABQ2JCM4_9ACTN|nr:hypothetical protein [Streptomyces kronopolitis]GGN44777.1 hypothetical protein GCM10012285_27680 [Streptomyces kronopolitis]
MLATAERVHPAGALGPAEIVWHTPTDPDSCDGNCDLHTVACGEPGTSVPGGIRDVPEDLTEPGQRWCDACLAGGQQTA